MVGRMMDSNASRYERYRKRCGSAADVTPQNSDNALFDLDPNKPMTAPEPMTSKRDLLKHLLGIFTSKVF
jgi:hypothetical protein